jgi:uncharacterized protein YggT (Ycf19 family)
MFILDFTELFWELAVKSYNLLFEICKPFRDFLENNIFVHSGFINKYITEFTFYILKFVSFKVFTYIRISLEIFRKLVFARFLVTWFPFFNPYGTIVEFLVAPVDMIIRPLTWHLPKYALVDLSSWFAFFFIESLMEICYYVERFAWLYDLQ